MKSPTLKVLLILIFISTANPENLFSASVSELASLTTNGGCIKTELFEGESVLRIVIEGTIEDKARLVIKNSNGDVMYNESVICSNERTVVDIDLAGFIHDRYVLSFKSLTMSCSSEFVY